MTLISSVTQHELQKEHDRHLATCIHRVCVTTVTQSHST